jgi:hypothetical protein
MWYILASLGGGLRDGIYGTSESRRKITSAFFVHSCVLKREPSEAMCEKGKQTSLPHVSCTRIPGIRLTRATRRSGLGRSRPEYPVMMSGRSASTTAVETSRTASDGSAAGPMGTHCSLCKEYGSISSASTSRALVIYTGPLGIEFANCKARPIVCLTLSPVRISPVYLQYCRTIAV